MKKLIGDKLREIKNSRTSMAIWISICIILIFVFIYGGVTSFENLLVLYNLTPSWVTGVIFLVPTYYSAIYAKRSREFYFLIIATSYFFLFIVYIFVYIHPVWWQQYSRPIFRLGISYFGFVHTGLFVYLTKLYDLIEHVREEK